MQNKSYAIFFVLLWLNSAIMAQPSHLNFAQKITPASSSEQSTFKIQGKVRALGSKTDIAEALVFEESNRENVTRTNKDGYFSILVPKNATGLIIRADNFIDLKLIISDGKLQTQSPFLLEPSAEYGGYGIIRVKKKDEISQNSFQNEEIAKTPGTARDAVRLLQTLPSVLPSNLGSADIVVRGGLPGDNSFYYDDLLLPFIFHFGGAQTIIPTRMIESMDFYPGAFSARYADTIGGLIQLKSPGNIPKQSSGEIELGLLQSGIYLEGNAFADNPEKSLEEQENDKITVTDKIEKSDSAIGYRLGFRRTYIELYKPLIQKLASDSNFVTIPQATDYQFILNGNHSHGTWQAYLLGVANRASLTADIGKSDTASGKNSFAFFAYTQLSGLRYSLNLGNGYGISIIGQQRYLIFQQNIFNNSLDAKSHLFTLGVILDKKVNEKISYSIGIRPKYAQNAVTFNVVQYPSGDPTVYFDPELAPRINATKTVDQYYGDVFLDLIYSPFSTIKINPGVNVLKGPSKNQMAVDPRFGIRYEFIEGQTFKAAWGYYSQLPAVQYTVEGFGNPNLDLERNMQYVLGHESKFWDNYSTDLQFWYKSSNNLVGPAVGNINNRFENSIHSRAKGVEVFLKKSASDSWFGWISYGWSLAEVRDPGSGIWRLSDYDRTHALNLVYGQKITNRWNYGFRLQYLSGNPYSTVQGGTFNQNTGIYAPAPDGSTYLINKNDGRIPYYMAVDFRTEYDFLFSDWTLTSYLNILNLFNRSNVSNITYNRDYSDTVKVTGLPILPSIGIIAKF